MNNNERPAGTEAQTPTEAEVTPSAQLAAIPLFAEVPGNINELSKLIHQNAIDKGFFEKEKNIGEMLCLIHSEVSEALEADRIDNYLNPETNCKKNKDFLKTGGWAFDIVASNEEAWCNWFRAEVKNTFQDELADIMIRVMELAAFKGIDLQKHIALKMRYNATREMYHGKKY